MTSSSSAVKGARTDTLPPRKRPVKAPGEPPRALRPVAHVPDRIMEDPDLRWSMAHRDRLDREDRAANESGEPFESEVRIVMPSGEVKWIQLSSMPSPQVYQGQVLWSGVILDVTERKRAEEEKNRLVRER